MSDTGFRMEHDLLGDLPVPADAYYGVQTRGPWRTSTSRAFPSASTPT